MKVAADPNNKQWSANKSRFGYQMLLKMGWSEGKGLGKEEQGEVDCIKLNTTKENQGLGQRAEIKEVETMSWTVHKNNFDQILQRLSAKATKSTSSESSAETPSEPPTSPTETESTQEAAETESRPKSKKRKRHTEAADEERAN